MNAPARFENVKKTNGRTIVLAGLGRRCMFGVGIAMERVFATVCGCFAFSAAIALSLSAVAATLGHVTLAATQWLALAVVLVLGASPFCAIRLAIGLLVRPNSATAVVNLSYLPLSFCSGLWISIAQLLSGVRHAADLLPTYHLGALALDAVGFTNGTVLEHVAWLAVWGVGATAVAVWAFGRDEGSTYG